MPILDLINLAKENGIILRNQSEIVEEAKNTIEVKNKYSIQQIKENFDILLDETESEAYRLYKVSEKEYGESVLELLVRKILCENSIVTNLEKFIPLLCSQFACLNQFYLSLSQSRKARAGKAFESIHNSLFKTLKYPFNEQCVINGKPDFLLPSEEHYRREPMDCIVFTAKRTLRERWRQIVTEGTRGLGFFLATIDDKVSENQLREMQRNRIYLVCPNSIKSKCYNEITNVLNFQVFFRDYLDPAMERWKRKKII